MKRVFLFVGSLVVGSINAADIHPETLVNCIARAMDPIGGAAARQCLQIMADAGNESCKKGLEIVKMGSVAAWQALTEPTGHGPEGTPLSPEYLNYMAKAAINNPKTSGALIGLGLIGGTVYKGYTYVSEVGLSTTLLSGYGALNLLLDSKNKIIGAFATTEDVANISNKTVEEVTSEFEDINPAAPIGRHPDPRGISTRRLNLLATIEEEDNADSHYWRECFAKRMKEEEEADHKLALEQGTLD